MRVMFIQPKMVAKELPEARLFKQQILQSLTFAMFASIALPRVDNKFYDDRLKWISYDDNVDLVSGHIQE
jgi:hypothetical protein